MADKDDAKKATGKEKDKPEPPTGGDLVDQVQELLKVGIARKRAEPDFTTERFRGDVDTMAWNLNTKKLAEDAMDFGGVLRTIQAGILQGAANTRDMIDKMTTTTLNMIDKGTVTTLDMVQKRMLDHYGMAFDHLYNVEPAEGAALALILRAMASDEAALKALSVMLIEKLGEEKVAALIGGAKRR